MRRTVLVDDLNQNSIATRTVTVGYMDTTVELDLGEANAAMVDDFMKPLIEAGRRRQAMMTEPVTPWPPIGPPGNDVPLPDDESPDDQDIPEITAGEPAAQSPGEFDVLTRNRNYVTLPLVTRKAIRDWVRVHAPHSISDKSYVSREGVDEFCAAHGIRWEK